MSPVTAMVFFVGAVCLGALFTGMETVALTANRIRIQRDQSGWGMSMRDVFRLLGDTQRTAYAATMGHILCLVVAAVSADHLIRELPGNRSLLSPESVMDDAVVLAVLTPLYIFVARLLPKFYFSRHPESRLLAALEPVQWMPRLLVPPLMSLTALVRRLFAPIGARSSTRRVVKLTIDDLREMLSTASHAGRDLSVDRKMIYGVFRLEQTIVREIMQPLVNVAAIRRDELTREGVLALGRVSGYTRIPVYTSRVFNMDGVVNVARMLRAEGTPPVRSFIEAPFYVPETMRADKLLARMISENVDMAIVIDEYGGTVGVVSQEDVIEEVVGDIEDEFDPTHPQMIVDEDGNHLIDGRMDIDDLNDRFGIRLPNEDFDTLGGFIYDSLGRVPRVGDTVETDRLSLEVMTMDGKRIERVKLILNPDGDAEAPSIREDE